MVARRRESPLSTVPACVSLPPKALLSEVSCTASSVEVVLDDANDLRWGDAQDVARDDISRANRIIDDQHRQSVSSIRSPSSGDIPAASATSALTPAPSC